MCNPDLDVIQTWTPAGYASVMVSYTWCQTTCFALCWIQYAVIHSSFRRRLPVYKLWDQDERECLGGHVRALGRRFGLVHAGLLERLHGRVRVKMLEGM